MIVFVGPVLKRVLLFVLVIVGGASYYGLALSPAKNNMPPSSSFKKGAVLRKLPSIVKSECKKAADVDKAKAMQGYLKTTMPMYGLQKAARTIVEKEMYAFILHGNEEQNPYELVTGDFYRDCIQTLWNLPHREEKYLAIDFALKFKEHITWDNIDIYEGLLRDSHDIMWWDFVDPIAVNLIGKVALQNQTKMEPILRQWIDDEDHMWIRRTAILAQLKHKRDTNKSLLLEFCRKRMHEKEFFIRKAIGWALREYSKTNPNGVIQFLKEERSSLSGLSYREGSKVLVKKGLMNAA